MPRWFGFSCGGSGTVVGIMKPLGLSVAVKDKIGRGDGKNLPGRSLLGRVPWSGFVGIC